MLRKAASRVAWVGRTASMVFGLALVLAMIVGVATMALAAVPGDPFKLGQVNTINALTQLVGNRSGPMLLVDNNSTGDGASALNLQVDPGNSPIKVNANSGTATNLSADELDGKNQSAFADVSELGGQQAVHVFGPLPVERTFTSEGGTLVILASGSGYRGGGVDEPTGRIAMDVRVNGSPVGRADVFADEPGLHETFVDEYSVVEGLPAGTHKIRLEPNYDDDDCNTADETTSTICTATNSRDFFTVTVIELSD